MTFDYRTNSKLNINLFVKYIKRQLLNTLFNIKKALQRVQCIMCNARHVNWALKRQFQVIILLLSKYERMHDDQ